VRRPTSNENGTLVVTSSESDRPVEADPSAAGVVDS
jgi:hypothetical protein